MICVVPAYDGPDDADTIHVSLFVKNSDGKTSESHAFAYIKSGTTASVTGSLNTGMR